MKIKRFHAKDMRHTIRKVREELGADAVILSNRRVADGVEIIAAVDYDESLLGAPLSTSRENESTAQSTTQEHLTQAPAEDTSTTQGNNQQQQAPRAAIPEFNIPEIEVQPPTAVAPAPAAPEAPPAHIWSQEPSMVALQDELKSLRGLLVNQLSGLAWGQETRYHPLRARLLQRLLALGLSATLAREIAAQCDGQEDFERNWRCALGELSHRLPMAGHDIVEQGGVVALVGATGVGKTTTIAKLAARYTLRHGPQRVVLITTDNNRVAAHEQLRSYARILGVPMRVAADAEALKKAIHSFSDKGLILIDTAGMSQRDMKLSQHLSMLRAGSRDVRIYLTLAVNSQRRVLEEVAQAYKEITLAGSILTKLDETTSLGGALSVALEQGLPIAYFSDGQKVPEDLHLARPHSLVSRSVAIMQQLAAANKDEAVTLAVGGMVANANG